MHLKDLEVFVVGTPQGTWGGRYFIFTKLTTSNGITGYGECYAAAVGPDVMTAVIEDVFARHMAGETPENVELMYRRAYSSGFTQRPDPTVMGPFEGQKHDPKTFFSHPEAQAEAALNMVENGFTAVKFDPAGPYTIYDGHQPAMYDLDRSEACCKAIRGAVGARADLLFGTHGQFTTSGAIRLARRIEAYDPLWFEEPCPPDNLLEFQSVAQSTRIPVATGERLTTKAEFATLLRTGGASILQPALGRVGGIWEAKKIAAIAEVFNAQMAPHLYAGPIEWAANVHLAASCPNTLIVESISDGKDFHADLVRHPMQVEDGHIAPPDAPGLGVELNEDLARAHPYTGDHLHLEMQDAPYGYAEENWFSGGAAD
jgi:L-alanine-DL-glutamate epimerase-like enolase superfamily enzyme